MVAARKMKSPKSNILRHFLLMFLVPAPSARLTSVLWLQLIIIQYRWQFSFKVSFPEADRWVVTFLFSHLRPPQNKFLPWIQSNFVVTCPFWHLPFQPSHPKSLCSLGCLLPFCPSKILPFPPNLYHILLFPRCHSPHKRYGENPF